MSDDTSTRDIMGTADLNLQPVFERATPEGLRRGDLAVTRLAGNVLVFGGGAACALGIASFLTRGMSRPVIANESARFALLAAGPPAVLLGERVLQAANYATAAHNLSHLHLTIQKKEEAREGAARR